MVIITPILGIKEITMRLFMFMFLVYSSLSANLIDDSKNALEKEDYKEFYSLLDQLCDNGNKGACLTTARGYMDGLNGLSVDYKKMKKYFNKACVPEYVGSCIAIRIMYLAEKHGREEEQKKLNSVKDPNQ